jgi:4-hydroxy-tetrahydrodipicolinate synthase
MTHTGNPFGQVLVALVTPMTADGEVDWPAVEKHIDDVITAGADGIVVTGTTGETSTLTDPEKLKLVEVGKDVASGRAKIITGGGSNETAHAIELYKASEKAGADGIMIVTPYYNKPTQAGILTHFRLVADATDLPVILYDIPGRTGVPIKYETILRLAKHPNILAIKDAKGDFSEVSRVLNQTDLLYFSGDDANVLPHLAIGATGLIGVTANITATPYRTIVDAVNRGDLAAATACARHGECEVHPPRPRPHRQPPRAPAARRPRGMGGRDHRGRARPRDRRARRRFLQLPPRPQRGRGRRAAEGPRHDPLTPSAASADTKAA